MAASFCSRSWAMMPTAVWGWSLQWKHQGYTTGTTGFRFQPVRLKGKHLGPSYLITSGKSWNNFNTFQYWVVSNHTMSGQRFSAPIIPVVYGFWTVSLLLPRSTSREHKTCWPALGLGDWSGSFWPLPKQLYSCETPVLAASNHNLP